MGEGPRRADEGSSLMQHQRAIEFPKRLVQTKSMGRAIEINYFDSVWDAIEPSKAEAANMKARADLMIAFHKTILGWDITQAAAAKRLGLTQPRLNDLLKGRITKFSLEALTNSGTSAGLDTRLRTA